MVGEPVGSVRGKPAAFQVASLAQQGAAPSVPRSAAEQLTCAHILCMQPTTATQTLAAASTNSSVTILIRVQVAAAALEEPEDERPLTH